MFCKFKNVECEHAGKLTVNGSKEWGEKEGIYSITVCYNDSIGRDVTKCNKEERL
jgi:hypothetical protein